MTTSYGQLNPDARVVNYLISHPDKIDWNSFSENRNSIAVKYLLENPGKINWKTFSYNESILAVN